MSEASFDLSLIICTRNRAAQLAQTLTRLSVLRSALEWELIIVDNESKDKTSAVVEEFAATFDHPVRMIKQEGRGVSVAKNAGWQSARADIVVCLDDDCYPEADYLDAIYECFAKDPKLGFVGGRILLYDPTDRRITIQESLDPMFFPAESFIRAGVVQGANIGYRRQAISAAGGFDPWFGAGAFYSGDELELMARISAAGWNGAYDPKPVVYHHHGRKTAEDELRLTRWYDRGRGAYYAKCILNRGMRWVYIKNWLSTRQHESWRRTVKEVLSGLEYVARAYKSGRLLHG